MQLSLFLKVRASRWCNVEPAGVRVRGTAPLRQGIKIKNDHENAHERLRTLFTSKAAPFSSFETQSDSPLCVFAFHQTCHTFRSNLGFLLILVDTHHAGRNGNRGRSRGCSPCESHLQLDSSGKGAAWLSRASVRQLADTYWQLRIGTFTGRCLPSLWTGTTDRRLPSMQLLH